MDKAAIADLRVRYRARGLIKGSEFLLPASDALALARDLGAMGAVIVGCDLWAYADRAKGWIKELLGAGYVVDDAEDPLSAGRGAAIAEEFLRHQVPDDVDFVSFLLEDGDLVDWFA